LKGVNCASAISWPACSESAEGIVSSECTERDRLYKRPERRQVDILPLDETDIFKRFLILSVLEGCLMMP